jgi:peptide/nickel transport system substrate-binding protein
MNTRSDVFADWRVREAMLSAFNFDLIINQTLNAGDGQRITVILLEFGARHGTGPAEGRVREMLEPYRRALSARHDGGLCATGR